MSTPDAELTYEQARQQLAKICQAWLDGAKAKIDAARGQQPG